MEENVNKLDDPRHTELIRLNQFLHGMGQGMYVIIMEDCTAPPGFIRNKR